MKTEPADELVLRAKYLDWCSARVADRFLELTPDQIFDLAHRAAGRAANPTVDATATVEHALNSGVDGVAPDATHAVPSPSITHEFHTGPIERAGAEGAAGDNYRALVARVTEALAERLVLPTFEEWVVAYRREPERFEEELLGLWQRKD